MRDYHINVFYSEEDGCYIADIPDLKYCSAAADRPQDAVREVLRAKKLWLETARAHRQPLPRPKYCPAIYRGMR